MSAALKNYSKVDIIKAIVTLALPLSLLLIPTGDVFTAQMRLFCVITLMGILCYAFENVNQTVVSILMPISYIFLAKVDAGVVFSPWAGYVPWATLAGLVMATVLQSCGLLARISYFFILRTGGSYKGVVWGISIVAFLLTMTIGDVAIPMAALAFGICMAMDLGTSRASGGIMLATAMACLMPSFIRMLAPIFLMGLAEPVTGPMQFLGFFEVWWVHLPSILFIFLMVFIITKIQKPEKEINGKDYFRQKYAECGKMSVREIKSAIILIFYLTFIIFHDQLFANWNMSWGLAFIPMLFAVPGIGAATAEDLKGINYGFTIFITACMAIGSVATSLGIGNIIADVMGPMLEGKGATGFFMITWVMLVALNFVMTPLAMQAAFTLPLTNLAMTLGINPMALFYFMWHACDQVIFPYEYAMYMIFFAFDAIRMKDFMKVNAIKMGLDFVVVFAILIPWWKMIGFLYV